MAIEVGNDFIDNIFKWYAIIDNIDKSLEKHDEDTKKAVKLATLIESLKQSGKIDESQAKILMNSDPDTVLKVIPKIYSIPPKIIKGRDYAIVIDPLTGKKLEQYDLTDPEQKKLFAQKILNESKVVIHDEDQNKIMVFDKQTNQLQVLPYSKSTDFDQENRLIDKEYAYKLNLAKEQANARKYSGKRFEKVFQDPYQKDFQILFDRWKGKYVSYVPYVEIDQSGKYNLTKYLKLEHDDKDMMEFIPLIQVHLQNVKQGKPWWESFRDTIWNFLGRIGVVDANNSDNDQTQQSINYEYDIDQQEGGGFGVW